MEALNNWINEAMKLNNATTLLAGLFMITAGLYMGNEAQALLKASNIYHATDVALAGVYAPYCMDAPTTPIEKGAICANAQQELQTKGWVVQDDRLNRTIKGGV